ncbi:MAG: hypothetical protein AOA65_1945 [Candidatus Bathyarchaeota archaeon BA1]|nr:MAG: hypothetical protein AOA65_1945 [Candidatus Bathyarchaeota archaeon BA1]
MIKVKVLTSMGFRSVALLLKHRSVHVLVDIGDGATKALALLIS